MRAGISRVVGLSAVFVLLAAVPSSGAPQPPVVRFTAAGDYSSGTSAQAVLSSIGALDADLHLALGDLSYGATGSEQAWCDLVTSRVGAGFAFELIAGNHESNGQNGNINDFSACLPNQLPGLVGTYGRQAYVDVPQDDPLVRYVMISPALQFPDSTWTYTVGSPRYNWTVGAIDGARGAGIPWVVVAMHKPCLSIGAYTCEQGADLTNMLVAKKVDLVLNGHQHVFQRTKQLAHGAGCPAVTPGTFTAACVADGDSTMAKGGGTVFTTIGTGGVNPLHDVNASDPEAPYFAATSGLNSNATFGSLEVTVDADELSARFVRASGGTFTDTFTIGPDAPANAPPVAAFTVSCTTLTCSFDGNGSSDPDGSVTSYNWDFGDGSNGTGVAPSHTYTTAGSYDVRLTVTDDDQATGSTTRTANPTAPASPTFANDTFSRTVSGGLGTADSGGTWSLSGSSADFSVSGGSGRIRLSTASASRGATLGSVSQLNTDLTMSVATDKPATGGGLYVSTRGRQIPGVGDYRAKVRLNANGTVGLSIGRVSSAGAETTIQPEAVVSALNYAVGDRLNVRVQVTGQSPTTIRAKVWKAGTSQPATWQRSVTDNTASFQAAGSIGVTLYLSSSATNAPIVVSIDDLVARVP